MNNYIIKTFAICAENGREAASRARWMPRVKHHAKDAILSVKEIDEFEYDEIIEINGKQVFVLYDLAYKISRYGVEPVDITVRRNGETVYLSDVTFPTTVEQGITFAQRDFAVYALGQATELAH